MAEPAADAAAGLASLWPHQTNEGTVRLIYSQAAGSPEARARVAQWAAGPELDPVLHAARLALLPGVLRVETLFDEIPRQWPDVFARMRGTEPVAVVDEVVGPALARLRPHGAPPVHDRAAGTPAYSYSIAPLEVALSVRLRRSTIDDGTFFSAFVGLAQGLVEAFVQTEEIRHASVFNAGRQPHEHGGDGCPLISDGHPYRGGTYSNQGTDHRLSRVTLEEIITQRIWAFPDSGGRRLRARPRLLLVPIDLQFVAYRIWEEIAADAPDTRRNPYPSKGYCVLDYLTDPAAWFVTTAIAGLASISWQPFRLNFSADDGDLILEATQSYGVGHYNPRAVVGSFI